MKTAAWLVVASIVGAGISSPALCANADHVYRGTLGERGIELYLAEREQPCNGEPVYRLS